jgi:hypothetical protein
MLILLRDLAKNKAVHKSSRSILLRIFASYFVIFEKFAALRFFVALNHKFHIFFINFRPQSCQASLSSV